MPTESNNLPEELSGTYPRVAKNWQSGAATLEVLAANGCRVCFDRHFVLGLQEMAPRGEQTVVFVAGGTVTTRHKYDELHQALYGDEGGEI